MKTMMMLILTLSLILRGNAQNITVNSTLADKYLAFGSGSMLHDGTVIQTGIDVGWEHLTISGWNSLSPDNKINLGDEVDGGLAWRQKLGKLLGIDNVSSDTSVTYFNEPGLGHLGKGDICMLVEKISAPTKFGVLALNVQNYQTMPESGFSGGWLIGPSLARNNPINEKWSVFTKAGLNMTHGFGMDEGVLAHAFISADYKVNKDLTWSVLQVTPYVPLTAHDLENDAVVATAVTIKL